MATACSHSGARKRVGDRTRTKNRGAGYALTEALLQAHSLPHRRWASRRRMDWEKKSVLFVDDEKSTLSAIQRGLMNEPYLVRIQNDPAKALEEIEERPPDVVVADYMMPEMVGPVFLSKVREINGGIVRLILTDNADLFKILCAINEGQVHRFLLKPCAGDDLRMVVRNAFDYADVMRERDHLLAEMDQQRAALESLERHDQGHERGAVMATACSHRSARKGIGDRTRRRSVGL